MKVWRADNKAEIQSEYRRVRGDKVYFVMTLPTSCQSSFWNGNTVRVVCQFISVLPEHCVNMAVSLSPPSTCRPILCVLEHAGGDLSSTLGTSHMLAGLVSNTDLHSALILLQKSPKHSTLVKKVEKISSQPRYPEVIVLFLCKTETSVSFVTQI